MKKRAARSKIKDTTHQTLLQQIKNLKALNKAKNRSLALTTHELRAPLAAMLACAEMIKKKLYDNEDEFYEMIDTISEQGKHLSNLINDILDFSKIQAGKMDFYIHKDEVTNLVEKQIKALRPLAKAHQVILSFKASEDALLAYFDEFRLKQAITNIISNAIHCHQQGGLVEVWLEKKKLQVEIHIKDHGCGIKPNDMTKIFNEFESISDISHNRQGTGLGLPISKRLVEGMGGGLFFSSKVKVGTHFWLTLPTKKVLGKENYRQRREPKDQAC